MDSFQLPDGYDRHKTRRQLTVRRLTDAEIYDLPQHIHRVKLICNDGQLRDVRMNGSIRRWKTMPDRISIPLKVGFREAFRLDLLDARRDLVMVVEDHSGEDTVPEREHRHNPDYCAKCNGVCQMPKE